MSRCVVALVAIFAIAVSVWQLETGRGGLEITPLEVPGGTPATLYRRADAGPAPAVVIAHGFAGSQQLMASYALTLARAGHLVATFDFEGHGRNPTPMSGDVTSIDGTTQLLMAEAGRVADALLAQPEADGRLAYLGHSMAADIIVRQALESPTADAVVAVSMFSRAVTADEPRNLLVIVGDWEPRLKAEALRVLAMADSDATPGETVGEIAEGTARRVVFAPRVEHVGVLYSQVALAAARDWLDAVFADVTARAADAGTDAPVARRGGWISLLLAGIVALAWPLCALLPAGTSRVTRLSTRRFAVAALLPAALVPLVLWPLETRVLPALVADYLVLHFALYGAVTLALLWRAGALTAQAWGRVAWIALAVAVFSIVVFGAALDRYVASFFPHAGRVAVIVGLVLGAVPLLVGDALLTEGGRAPVWRVLLVRGAFVVSLGIAVALDPGSLFFLLIILPVIVLFFLVFGTIGGWVGRRTGLPVAAGLGLGVVLAWAVGVSFPMFVG